MPEVDFEERVLRGFANSSKAQIEALRTPLSRHAAQMPVDEMMASVTRARLELSSRHMQIADLLLRSGELRGAIGRYYYAMYHAARAVVFACEEGDDFESHGNVPAHMPQDFPERVARVQVLTDARLLRNEADYDPFPLADAKWESDARRLVADAAEFCRACDDYLTHMSLAQDASGVEGETHA